MNASTANNKNTEFKEWCEIMTKCFDYVGEKCPSKQKAKRFYDKGFTPKETLDFFLENEH